MTKKVIIAGGRHYHDYARVKKEAMQFLAEQNWQDAIIVSGGASGVDALGERFAREQGFAIEQHPADWQKHGRAAGPIRNRDMAEAADALLAFWDGASRGTKSMIGLAQKNNLAVKVIAIKEETA